MAKFLLASVLAVSSAVLPVATASAADRDGDGIRDRWERRYGLSTKHKSGKGDPDRDRLSNRREFKLRTNPRKADTDGDGLRDRAEVRRHHTNPRRRDSDKDGFSDRQEIRAGTDPRNKRSHPPKKPRTPSPPPPAPAPPGPTGPTGPAGPRPVVLSCTRTAPPATFAAQVSAASAGETVCLASGSYGSWGGTAKQITVGPQPGAAVSLGIGFGGGDAGFALVGVTVTGGSITGGARDITIRDSVFTGQLKLDGLASSNVVLDHNSHNNLGAAQNVSPARIHLTWYSQTHSGVTISNSLMAGGDSDGVQSGVGVNVINNEFRDLCDRGGNHTDNVQLLRAPGSVVRGNYVHLTTPCTTQGIAAYDGLERTLIESNVVDIRRGWGIEVYSDAGSTVRHNTLKYYPPGCYGGSACGMIDINRKPADPAGTGTVVVDNIATRITIMNGSTLAARHHNLVRQSAGSGDTVGTPVFAGGANPTSYAGFLLAGGSAGKGAASDGADAGILP
jgi:hypothetical protein